MSSKQVKETKAVQLPTLYRTGTLRKREDTAEGEGEENRTYEIAFSSEEPYERQDFFGDNWIEVLGHKSDEVRMDWIASGRAPFLNDHSSDRQIGVIESAELKDSRGTAVIRLGKTDSAEEARSLIDDGIKTNVSVGYRVHRAVLEEENDEGPDRYRVTDWEPLETSLVSIPADKTVGVGRDGEKNGKTYPATLITVRSEQMETETRSAEAATVIEPDPEAFSKGSADEKKRSEKILDIVEACRKETNRDFTELGTKAIRDDWTVDQFREKLLGEVLSKAKPAETDPEIGLSKKDKKRYSLVNAYRSMLPELGNSLSGFEKECSDATAQRIKKEPKGFFIPPDIMRDDDGDMMRAMCRVWPGLMRNVYRNSLYARGLEAEITTAGGFTVGTEVDGANMIELLRNATMVASMGATSLTGLTGNVALPKHTGGAVAYWLDENATTTASAQTFGQLLLTPHRLAADTFYTKQLLMQSSIDIEAFVRGDQVRVIAIAKDLAAIAGDGNNGEPIGIINTTGRNATVTHGGAPTWADIVEFETGVSVDNALAGSLGFLIDSATRGKWKTTVKESGQASYLMEGNMVNGYRTEVSQQISGSRAIFGNWSDLILADWDGIDVVVDPFSRKKTSEIEIHQELQTDVGIRNPVSFNVATDSSAQ